MIMEELDIINRLRYAKAKLRNIPFYWEYDESLGECRSRKQYMHVLRSFRKQLEALVAGMKESTANNWSYDIDKLQGLINIISPKVKTEECKETIEKLKNYVY
jgi:hypothetical protein